MIQPTDGILGIGSGGNYALAAARALVGPFDAVAPPRSSAQPWKSPPTSYIYTNRNIVVEEIPCGTVTGSGRTTIVPRADLTPRQIVAELDRYIVGQDDAKRAVAVAIRNRWRRQQLPDELRKDVTPKNILMIGPTGVGKTEIARRLAKLTGAPFIKVEATKYTEVGYYGRDVESMVRELVENAIGLVQARSERKRRGRSQRDASRSGCSTCCSAAGQLRRRRRRRSRPSRSNAPARRCGPCCAAGELEDRKVEIDDRAEGHADA